MMTFQVYTRVMAPVSVFLHQLGIHVLRHRDDWSILESSLKENVRARDLILQLCCGDSGKLNLILPQERHVSGNGN